MKIANVTFNKVLSSVIWNADESHILYITGWGDDEDGQECWIGACRTDDGNIFALKDYDNGEYAATVLEHGEDIEWWNLSMLDMYRFGKFGKTDALDRRMNVYMAEFADLTKGKYYFPDAEDVLENAKEVIY